MLRAVLALARGDMAPPSGVEPSDVPPACSGLALPHAGSAMITSTTRCRTGERRRPGEGGGSPVPKRAKALSPGSSRPQRACDVCTDDQENAPAGEPLEACHADAETAETLRCGGGSSGSDVLSPGAALVLRPGLGELVSPAGCDWSCWLPQHGSCVAAEPGAASISACADTSCDVVPVPPALSASATGSQQNAGSPSSSSAPSVSGMAPLPQQPSHYDAAASDAAVAVAAASLMQQTSPSGAQCADSGGSECSEDGRFDEEEFDPLLFIGTLGPVDAYVIGPRQPLLPRQTRTCKQKTLVLDLDETLVHSTLDAGVGVGADFSFPVTFNGTEHTVHVRERPHMREFLARVATLFEVVVFTASQKVCARPAASAECLPARLPACVCILVCIRVCAFVCVHVFIQARPCAHAPQQERVTICLPALSPVWTTTPPITPPPHTHTHRSRLPPLSSGVC